MNRTGTARRRAKHLRRRHPAAGRRAAPATREQRAVARLVICGAIFVLLVAVKLLFPQTVSRLAQSAGQLIGRDADFQAAFAAVGRAISGEAAVGDSLQDAYTAVFSPAEDVPAGPTRTAAAVQTVPLPGTELLKYLEEPLPVPAEAAEETAVEVPLPEELPPAEEPEEETATAALSYVYTMPALPDNASLEQRNLGFPHVTPVVGAFSSGFGWREHPIQGGNKFHYGLDLAADTGTDILAFADGEVYATGESSTLGQYIILQHREGYRTLYAHCSQVTVQRGPVSAGEKIAEVGDSGMATGPHLHFALQDGELYLNPIYYVELG